MTEQPDYNHTAPKILVMGESGKGKTYSIGTLIEAGVTPFIIFTEPHQDIMLKFLDEHGLREREEKEGKLLVHWKYISPAAQDWTTMLQTAQIINTMTYKQLTQKEEINKAKFKQFHEVLRTMSDFVSDRDKVSYGMVDNWNTDRAICIDTLTGLSQMIMDNTVGAKPVKNPGDWNIAMTTTEAFLNKLVTDLQCWVIVNGHLEKEKNEVTGMVKNMVSALGSKLPPKIPRFFTDVIRPVLDDKDFHWQTVSTDTDLKTHHLPLFDRKIPQHYQAFVDSYVKIGGKILPTIPPEE